MIQKGYHSANNVVPTRDISSLLDSLSMATTMYQSHICQLMAPINQLKDNTKILVYQINQLDKTNAVLDMLHSVYTRYVLWVDASALE